MKEDGVTLSGMYSPNPRCNARHSVELSLNAKGAVQFDVSCEDSTHEAMEDGLRKALGAALRVAKEAGLKLAGE